MMEFRSELHAGPCVQPLNGRLTLTLSILLQAESRFEPGRGRNRSPGLVLRARMQKAQVSDCKKHG